MEGGDEQRSDNMVCHQLMLGGGTVAAMHCWVGSLMNCMMVLMALVH